MDKTIFLKVKRLQEDIDASSGVLPRKDVEKQLPVDAFDQLVTDKALRKTVEKLYRDGHHARAVEEAYNFVKPYNSTRTRKPAEIIRFQRVSYVNCLSFAKRYSLIIAAQDLRCGFGKLEFVN